MITHVFAPFMVILAFYLLIGQIWANVFYAKFLIRTSEGTAVPITQSELHRQVWEATFLWPYPMFTLWRLRRKFDRVMTQRSARIKRRQKRR